MRTLNDVQITTAPTSAAGAPSTRMTCVTFTSPQVTNVQSGHFDIEPFVLAFRSYRRLRLMFIAPAGLQFGGLRSYHDRRVDIDMTQVSPAASATYTYDVAIKDGSFASLDLPTMQADPAVLQYEIDKANQRKRLVLKIVGFIFIASVATLVGYVAYTVMASKPSTV
jgi:hypothetical protein